MVYYAEENETQINKMQFLVKKQEVGMSYLNDYALNEVIRQHQQEIHNAVRQQKLGAALTRSLPRSQGISIRKRINNGMSSLRRRIGLGMISLGKQLAQVQRAA